MKKRMTAFVLALVTAMTVPVCAADRSRFAGYSAEQIAEAKRKYGIDTAEEIAEAKKKYGIDSADASEKAQKEHGSDETEIITEAEVTAGSKKKFGSDSTEASFDHPVLLADYLVDVGTISDFNEELAIEMLPKRYLPLGSDTCILKQLNENNLIGRNLDASPSRNPAFKFVLDINRFRAIGIAYSSVMNAKLEDVLENGVSSDIRRILPYVASDYLNEAGLYIQSSTRNNEKRDISSGTAPGAEVTLHAGGLPAYLATRCATVGEAVSVAKQLNLYTSAQPKDQNYAFLIADADGNYGIMEIVNNEVIFIPHQNGHANGYVYPQFAKKTKYQYGMGRYAVAERGLPRVHSQRDMLRLMEKLYYSQCYNAEDPFSSSFDIRSEFVRKFPVNEDDELDPKGDKERCTTKWLTNDKRLMEVYGAIQQYVDTQFANYRTDDGYDMDALRRDVKVMPEFRVTAYSLAVDCSRRKMDAHFWENADETLTFSFE